jgi:hypothetical protein
MTSRRRTGIALGALVLAALAVRVAAVGVPGHMGDVRVMARWAERIADVGPPVFYEGSGAIYPALLYPLWGLGAVLDGDALLTAIKALSIPFDLANGVLLAALVRTRLGDRAAVGAGAVYLLNPAVLLAGPVWGQVDAAGTLAFVGAVAAGAAGRYSWAGALGAVATLVKPQFALAAIIVLCVAAIRSWTGRTWRPGTWAVVGGAAAYAVVAAPLALHPMRYVDLLRATASAQPFTSLNAFNPWALLVGFRVPDEPYVGIGAALLAGAVVATLLTLRRGTELATVLAVSAVAALAFYMLPTRVHERYLFPAMALLVPFAMLGWRWLGGYVAISLAFAASLVYALDRTTPFAVPAPLQGVVTSPATVWAIAGILIVSSAAWAGALLVRPPPPLARERREP